MYSFGELFATYLSAETVKVFKDVAINECVLNSDNRNINLKIYGEKYIPYAKINILREEIKHALKLESVNIEISYSNNAFCVAAAEDIVLEIRAKSIIFNGFFNDAQYLLDGNNLNITLKYGGYSKIQEANFENRFKQIVKNRFNIDINIC